MNPIKTIQDYLNAGETPEILFWVGCAGSFDERAQRVSKAFASILQKADIKFAILGTEEGCTGDPAKQRVSFSDAGHAKHRAVEWIWGEKDGDGLSALLQHPEK
jgi:Fe-S oxidoreductase